MIALAFRRNRTAAPRRRLTLRGVVRRTTLWLVAGCILLGLAVLRIWDPLPVETLRVRTFDLFQIIKPRAPSAEPVLMVDVDERSLREIGQWPWPRTLVAALTRTLLDSGARVVAFDFIFPEPDRTSPASMARWFPDLPADAARILRRLPSNDDRFADVIRGEPVVLGQAINDAERDTPEATDAPGAVAALGADPRPYLPRYPALLRNLPALERAATGHGLFSLGVERDNIVRRVPAIYRIGERIYPALVTEMLRVATGGGSVVVRSDEAGIAEIGVGGRRFSTDSQGRVWIHYARPTVERRISAADVLNWRVGRDRIGGRFVIVGTSAVGLRDIKATPLAPAVPGVEVHAQMLETILAGTGLTRPRYALGVELVVLLVAGALIAALVPLLGARWTLVLGALVMLPLIAGSWYLYDSRQVLIDVSFPVAGTFSIYVMLAFINYLRSESERRRIRTAFSRYLSPEYVSRLAENPADLKLGGEQREMTLLFSDVHRFTTISEQFDAVALTNLINSIFNPLTQTILEHGGTIDKYMGDSIMAFWNAPLADPDHARHACLAALEMGEKIPALNTELAAEAKAAGREFMPVNLGIGLNTGSCCVGNMGSDLRFDYSVLGDTVNIAARLEGQTRLYGVRNVIGESTAALARDLAMIELDLVTVLGKTTPVRIFTLLGDEAAAASDDFRALRDGHDAMLAAYRAQDWTGALAALERCRAREEAFGLAAMYDMYAGRIAGFQDAPPGPDWTAVFEARSKS